MNDEIRSKLAKIAELADEIAIAESHIRTLQMTDDPIQPRPEGYTKKLEEWWVTLSKALFRKFS